MTVAITNGRSAPQDAPTNQTVLVGDLVGDDGDGSRRHAVVDSEAVDLRARRGRLRPCAWAVDVVGTPGRAPYIEVTLPILPQQALLYRQCEATRRYLPGQRRQPGTELRRAFRPRGVPGEMLLARIGKEDGRLVATVTAPSRDNETVLSGVKLVLA